MLDGRLGFAIIGCGVISAFHARALAETPGARLVAVSDVVPDRAKRVGDEFCVPYYTDLRRALERDDVDAVSVCVPSGLHAAIGMLAAQAGKHVVVEKPIDVSLEAADRLIETCERAGVCLTVISQHRFDDGVRELRRLIDDRRLGRLVLGEAAIKWYRTQSYYDSGDWRGTWALDGGGALINQGVHYLDLLRWMMGPVDSVTACTQTAAHDIEVEDIALALLRFRSGALGVVQASTAVFPGLAERLDVSGTSGTVSIEDGRIVMQELKDEGREIGAYGSKRRVRSESPSVESAAADPAAIRHEAHRRQLSDFVEAVHTDRPPLVTGADGRRALQLIDAIYRSGRSGQAVRLHEPVVDSQ